MSKVSSLQTNYVHLHLLELDKEGSGGNISMHQQPSVLPNHVKQQATPSRSSENASQDKCCRSHVSIAVTKLRN